MNPDDLVCYCFRVSLRKLVNFARRERPPRASGMSQCLDAGTGCGWCIPYLERIWEDPDGVRLDEIDAGSYARERLRYHEDRKKGAPRRAFGG